ncbi:di-heme oxidoredictase family protein, partial [Stigmatella aurantiaca]
DLLLHDMGPGLADGRPDGIANGQEWRTAPLWGLGLTQTVLPYSGYLHDGRARSLEEAILWHGGEAERSREQFRKLPVSDRNALVKFLGSL